MTRSVKLLKGILKTSGWTQEQLAEKLGVSFVSLNAWVNGRTKPRKSMQERIEQLYLAQDVTKDVDPTYVTIVNVDRDLKVGDAVVLLKDLSNTHDDEAIIAKVLELNVKDTADNDEWEDVVFDGDDGDTGADAGNDADAGSDADAGNDADEIKVYTEQAVKMDCPDYDGMYVANSVNTVVRGTRSAGRIYDRFNKGVRAQVVFVFHRMAIAIVVEWDIEI